MLEKVEGLKIKGRCFESETKFSFFQNPNDRISIVYGKNGSGKSTISEALSCITENEFPLDLTATLINAEEDQLSLDNDVRLSVFNEKYIDENVKIDDDGLGTIIMLGKQVDLQSEIDKINLDITELEANCESLESQYENYTNLTNPLNPQYHWNRIITILKQPGGWAEIDSKIKRNRRNSSVTDDVIKEICDMATKLTSHELQKDFNDTKELLDKVSDISTTYPDEIKQIVYEKDWESKLINILSTNIDKPVLTVREKIILETVKNGGQPMLEDARQNFSHEETTICPYCFQLVSDTYKIQLVESINKVLNKDVDEYKDLLNSIVFPDVSISLEIYESLDSVLLKKIYDQIRKCQNIIDQYKTLTDEKKNNVYSPVAVSDLKLSDEIKELNDLLKQLDNKRKDFNSAAKQKKSLIEKLITLNKSIAHLQTVQIYKDYIKQISAKEKVKKSLYESQEALTKAKEELQKINERKSNLGLAIRHINNALDYVFFSHGRLSIELKNDKYYLKSNGKNVKPKNVSLGERNIIALCYFFTQILSNQEISELYKNESFIVIDDPISSFDFENKVGIMSFLRLQINRIINGNSKSKILILSHDLETVFNMRKAADEICQSTKGIAGVTPSTYISFELNDSKLNLLTKFHNEYSALLKKVYHYANEEIQSDSITIGNAMRRVLEAFSTFNYQKSIEKVSCDKNVLSALGNYSIYFENLMYRLVLHGESHYEEQVYSIHDGNNFYKFISESEKKQTAKNIICFMFLLNSTHLIAYLQDEKDSINNIKLWVNNIPKNESFEITEAPTKIIPLYDLSLSAGVGNESFEGIPFEEYETDNMLCDFAVRISGNSMEPDIKDNSIALVKKSDSIDPGKTGAFYYNGKVYCKYLTYEKGATFLCSYNNSYDPIEIKDDDTLITYGEIIEVV